MVNPCKQGKVVAVMQVMQCSGWSSACSRMYSVDSLGKLMHAGSHAGDWVGILQMQSA